MFVISIVSAAVPPANPFPPTLLPTPARTGSASAAGPACRVRECFSGFRPTASAPQGISCAPAEHGAKLRYRAEQTKRKRKVPDPESGSQPTKPPPVSGPPPLFAGGNSPPLRQPGKTELSRRPCRDSAFALLRAAEQPMQPSGSRCPAHIPDISGPGARSRRPRNAPNTTRRGSPHSRRSRRRNRSRAGPANRTVPACWIFSRIYSTSSSSLLSRSSGRLARPCSRRTASFSALI